MQFYQLRDSILSYYIYAICMYDFQVMINVCVCVCELLICTLFYSILNVFYMYICWMMGFWVCFF